MKWILLRIYAKRFDASRNAGSDLLSTHDIIDPVELSLQIERAIDLELALRRKNGNLELTPAGRKEITVVMTGGSFDIIHPGHLETLQKARALGDFLVVSVARDSTFLSNKKRDPLHGEKLRRQLVEALRPVDAAILGSQVDIYEMVKLLEPDVIALGYDQSHNEAGIKEELRSRGLTARVIRLDSSMPEIKSSKITREFFQD
ncbi:MAG: adenylyltransferase/cytidyltransferase family protein [Nitrososphaerales archaeon]